jgi:Mrp family chromosome partitioning ATPase
MAPGWNKGIPSGTEILNDACAHIWIDLRHAWPGLRSLIVTGCGGGEGVTSIALALGRAAHRLGSSRVLLIDAAPSANGLTARHAPSGGRGIRQFRDAETDLQGLVRPIGPGLDLLPLGAGGKSILPPDEDLKLLQERALQSYDLVIWDVPPITGSVEVKLLITLVGNVALVAETDRTRSAQVSAALDQIRALSAQPLAVLRNRAARAPFGFGTRRE